MAGDELTLIWRQVEALHEAVSALIELQRAAVAGGAGVPATASAGEAIGDRLDELQARLQPHRQQSAERAARLDAGEQPRFAAIDVGRINVVEPDGTERMVISNKANAPAGGRVNGKTLERQGGASAGILFYNEEGDECGGLIYSGKRENGGYDAGAGLLFDQFKQDQVVGIQCHDANGQRFAGLNVWDRPDLPLDELDERYAALRQLPEGPERDAAVEQMAAEGLFAFPRVFVGKALDRAAVIRLCDARGRVRLRLAVEAMGTPSLEFLDEAGQVTYRLPSHDSNGE